MGLAFLAFLGLMAFSPVSRRVTLIAALLVACYMAFDNLVTEVPAPAAHIQLRNVETYVFGAGTSSPMVKIGFDARNDAGDELESVDLLVSLEDCTGEPCEVVGRRVTRVQLLAPGHASRHAETLVRFENIAPEGGEMVPQIRLLGGTADRF